MTNKTIIQIDPTTNQIICEHISIRSAARKLGLGRESIRAVLNSERILGNYKWIVKDTRHTFTPAKILLLDIETAPTEAYVWGLWKQNIYIDQIISDWYMLSWAAKWLYEEDIESDVLTSDESLLEDDSRILTSLWTLMDQADIIIGHNLDQFDIPRIKTRFLLHDIEPPSFYKQLDTLKIARKEFDFSSNKLDYLAKMLGLQVKNNTDFNLWKNCRAGDRYALEEMKVYNVQDVRVLEDVYLKLRPYIKGHPNLDLYTDQEDPTCPHCGTSNICPEEGKFAYTQAVRYQMFRCGVCLSISRAKKGTPYNNKKKISAIPR